MRGAVALCLACFLSAGGETLDITAAALGINSARVPSVSILTADVATVTGGVYANTSDGTTSILDITGGTWKSWDPSAGISSTMKLGAIDDAAATALNGPVTIRLSGAGTRLVSRYASAGRCGNLRVELLDGASWLNTNTLSFAGEVYRKGNMTLVMNNASFESVAGQTTFGGYESQINSSSFNLYVTNSTWNIHKSSEYSSWTHGYYNNGKYVFSGSTVTVSENHTDAFSILTGADVLLCDKTTFSANVRLGCGTGKPCSLTIDDATAVIGGRGLNIGQDCYTQTAAVHLVRGVLQAKATACEVGQPAWLDLQGGTFKTTGFSGGSKTHAKNPSGNGFARLTCNGVTIQCTGSTSASGWDLAEVGSRGVVFESDNYDLSLNQDLVSVTGEEGWLLKRGGGTFTLRVPSAYSIPATTIEGGTLLVSAAEADASVTLATHLSMTNGTTLSTVGNAKNLTVNALDLPDVVLKIDPTDTITVTGAASVTNLTMQFSSAPGVNTTNHFLTVRGAISSDSIAAISNAVIDSVFASGTYGELSAKATAEGTVFTMTTKPAAVVSGETEWKGPGAAWADDANWSDKVPVATNTASFADATAPSEVTVASAADVGALSFSAGNFKLTGAGSLNFGAPGSSSVTVSSGAHTVDVAVVQKAVTPVSVAADTSLLFAKRVTGGGLSKTGTGHLTLAGANAFAGPLSLAAGWTEVKNGGALSGVGTLLLGDATLETTEPIELLPGTTLKPAATAANKAVIVKNEADLTVQSVEMGTGCLMKRGLGTLTIDARLGRVGKLANNAGSSPQSSSNVTFPADGTPPTTGVAGFTVVEGEVVIRGTSATPITFDGDVYLGIWSTEARANSVLTVDGAQVSQSGTYGVYLGYASWRASVPKYPTLRLVNGASLSTYKLSMAYDYNQTAGRYPTVAITNSTLTVGGDGFFFTQTHRGEYGRVLAKDANLHAASFSVNGRTESRVSASVLSTSDGGYATFGGNRDIRGCVLFDEGTILKINKLSATDFYSARGGDFVFAFDDATWDIGPDSLKIDSSNLYQGTEAYPKTKKFEVRAGGLTLMVASGQTLQTEAEFRGYGPLTLTGGGTLKFDDGAFGLTGTVAVASGTVDFSSVTAVSNNVIRGAGTVSGAAFKEGIVLDPQIASDWTVGAAPTFASCTFANGVTVDCSAAAAAGRPTSEVSVVVARYTGTAPDVSAWQLAGTGVKRLRATLTATDGEIRLNVTPRKGVVLFVR